MFILCSIFVQGLPPPSQPGPQINIPSGPAVIINNPPGYTPLRQN